MTRKKLIEAVLSAVSALITAAKSFIKFIGYIGKMDPEPTKT